LKTASDALIAHMTGECTTLAYIWELKQNALCCKPNPPVPALQQVQVPVPIPTDLDQGGS